MSPRIYCCGGGHHYQMSDRQARKDLERELANYRPSRYSKLYAAYQRRTLPRVEPILRAIAVPSPLAPRLPVYKTLRAAARMLLLNELELVQLALVVRESAWRIDLPLLQLHQHTVGELVSFPCDSHHYRSLTLYVLLAAWAAKTALNEDCQYMLAEVRRVCPQFQSIFQQWTGGVAAAFVFPPHALNRLFTLHGSSRTAAAADYQLVVDTILQLSQPYSSDRDASQPPSPPPRLAHFPSRPRKAQGVAAQFTAVEWEERGEVVKEEFEMNVFGNRELSQSMQFPGVFASSMGGIFGLGSSSLGGAFGLGSVQASKRSELEYFEVELGEGDHNFMVFSQGDPTLSSVLGMHRAVSHSEHPHQHEEARSEC